MSVTASRDNQRTRTEMCANRFSVKSNFVSKQFHPHFRVLQSGRCTLSRLLGVKVPDIIVSSAVNTLDHMKMNILFVGDTGHFHNENCLRA